MRDGGLFVAHRERRLLRDDRGQRVGHVNHGIIMGSTEQQARSRPAGWQFLWFLMNPWKIGIISLASWYDILRWMLYRPNSCPMVAGVCLQYFGSKVKGGGRFEWQTTDTQQNLITLRQCWWHSTLKNAEPLAFFNTKGCQLSEEGTMQAPPNPKPFFYKALNRAYEISNPSARFIEPGWYCTNPK